MMGMSDELQKCVEVAVCLPVNATFTYRDPRPGSPLALGTQVIVPFGRRTVTGFVVSHKPSAASQKILAIEGVAENEPAIDDSVLKLCLWASRYYLAPLGEVLRTAVPQSERARSQRKARLTERGSAFLSGTSSGASLSSLALDETDRALLRRLKSRSLSLSLLRRDPRVGSSRVDRLVNAGWVEVGDQIDQKSMERRERLAIASGDGSAELDRAPVQKKLHQRLQESPNGLCLSSLSAREKAALRALLAKQLARLESISPQRVVGASKAVRSQELRPELNEDQWKAVEALRAALNRRVYGPFLLHGITGSGKTEVYLRIIEEARASNRGALVLVPEIALTPQLAARFRARFGDDVAVLHSGLQPAQRRAAWRTLRLGKTGIAVGARSAVFAPVRDLGVIIVDEEHDPSFKQDDGVRYHGRDLALVRAKDAGAVAVLGSATPSLESYRNALVQKYSLLSLPKRAAPGAAQRPLPDVEVLDLRSRKLTPGGLFAPPLVEAIRRALAANEQVILFLNRRGFSTVVLCRSCGDVTRCRDCSVSMTYHKQDGRLVCHYCGRSATLPERCPSCHAKALEPLGAGTERLEADCRELFPGARVARLDRDTAAGIDGESAHGRDSHGQRATALESILSRVRTREIDILVGTQMVAKGHDFPGVTLVGVLQPDQGMHLPDFRSSERTFQLLEQVAGRAGRGEKPGRVVVQTFNPNHPAIAYLRAHDYQGFAESELRERREAGYPPWVRLAVLRLDGRNDSDVRAVSELVALRARSAGGQAVRVRGPAEAPISRIRGRTRYQVWLASSDVAALSKTAAEAASVSHKGVRVAVDFDPQTVL